jgi:peptidoglycan/LPS O-acetylase OafA/YrhL
MPSPEHASPAIPAVPAPPSAAHVPMLDGLRGVAILLVFLTHAVALPLHPATRLDAVAREVARVGWSGVDLFFVLSGFLITGILLDTKGQARWWPNFFARRALRIFPLYYGVLILLFLVLPHVVHWSEPAFATLQAHQAWYWAYLVNVLDAVTKGDGVPLNTSHLWSLSIEEQFYLVWPLVVWLCRPRTLLHVAAIAMLAGIAFRLWLVLADPFHDAASAYVLTPGRLDGLMTGAALAVLARMPGGLGRFRRAAPWIAGGGALALAVTAIARGGFEYTDAVLSVAGFPVIAVVYGALLVAALDAAPTSPLARILDNRSLGRWGKYSYGLYVIHYPLIGALARKLSFYQRGTAWLGGSRLPLVLAFAGLAGTLSYAMAWASYHLYEKRFLALKRYFESGGKAARP